ncbi:glycosyltransferase family 52 [Shewanella sp. 1_MG-2023]|uniref:glycosyltransferase family 52 n=1 Tax=unclassified Shewanella TaxID=196818 RepID=UPI0026E1F662|nr:MULTISPECIES: glycosyltransferase family 52 [unclassified Shewanella]MDO6610112.1 glycosyltransferase family 52 [Shewanella sp. 7_MG-2023]MDO6769746.1 glycosyltransferase family 52 [Shewanella sp. 2_MG-2023]MDO6792810.1 glycosyltransferase family 52 [Shewanella sp. 1_MG-2023]
MRSKKSNNVIENVLYVESLFSLCLYEFVKSKTVKTMYILGSNICSDELFDKFDDCIVVNTDIQPLSLIEQVSFKFGMIPSRLKGVESLTAYDVEYFGHDHLKLSIFLRCKKFTIIEDGLSNYRPQKVTLLKGLVTKFLGLDYKPYGFDHRIKKIYLTNLQDVHPDICDKVVLVDRRKLLESINDIFDSYFKIDAPYETRDGNEFVVLVTQPLSEDGIVNESEKLVIYRHIIENINKKVIIKPHPREKTNYHICFSDLDVYVLDSHKLTETIHLISNLKTVITLFSSLTFEPNTNIELVSLGTAFNRKLVAKFGEINISDSNYNYLLK